MNTFQRWIFHRGEYIFWGNIFRGEYFSGVNILQNKISTKIFPPQNFPFVHHYFWGGVMCQLDIFPFEFRTVEHCLVLNWVDQTFRSTSRNCNSEMHLVKKKSAAQAIATVIVRQLLLGIPNSEFERSFIIGVFMTSWFDDNIQLLEFVIFLRCDVLTMCYHVLWC